MHRAGFHRASCPTTTSSATRKRPRSCCGRSSRGSGERGYPLQFYTEASINLADDAELIELMAAANFRQVFIGIESPRRASLAETRKVQNIQGDALEAKVQRVRDGGLVVIAGFIVGFDADDEAIFDEQFEFIERTGIAQAARGPVDADPDHATLCAARGRGTARFHRSRRDLSSEADEPGDAQARLCAAAASPVRAGGVFRTAVPRISRFAGVPPPARRHGCGGVAPARRDGMGRAAPPAGVRQAFKLGLALARAKLLRRLGIAYAKIWLGENLPLGRDALPFHALRPRLRDPLALLQCDPIAAQSRLRIDRRVAATGRGGTRRVMSFRPAHVAAIRSIAASGRSVATGSPMRRDVSASTTGRE